MADIRLTRPLVQALPCVEKVRPPPTVVDRVEIVPKVPDSQLLEAPPPSVVAQVVEKKKRGRPPRNPGLPSAAALAAANKRCKKEKDDEDVCFICFDGGDLVLCDRRDCPKAYHPVCVKRDESFFRPNIRWDCGWHLCNICQRNALFMCYTCPYSLCKGCVKQADILCVRGNKGFCKACMTTVMLIENIPQENKESVKVDFDDTTSWEYLFKVYWIYLKQKESLTVEELTQSVNRWKGLGLEHKSYYHQLQSRLSNRVSETTNSYAHLDVNASKRRKTRGQSQAISTESQQVDKTGGDKASCLPGNTDWASKELLEFVSHMKNGDISVLSQFDVQALLLEYIRTNNLRDPRQKCQIVCDKRLENLLGKERVGHFEMLKLLEYHFKEESRINGVVRGAASDLRQVETEGISADMQTPGREMKRQTRKNGDENGRQNNTDSYAAIDVHNINLIYLKRSLLEKMMVDVDKFHDKVVGSIVRIKISSNDQKQDMHRLVRIIGTAKATESNKVGDKLENIMLKILNLNKIEDIMVDVISDQEFSEDECKRLRQSIKLGLVERITVGEIQEKARALQTMRISNWLETEITKLNHLRDRASEMGHRKELRECVEKIELLQTPEECQRRINDIPEVHADPRMDPSYGSDDDSGESDVKKRDQPVTPKYNSNSRGVELISPTRVTDTSRDRTPKTVRTSTVNGERKRKVTAKTHVVKLEGATRPLELSPKLERVDAASRVLEEPGNQADSSGECGVVKVGSNSQVCSDISELEKIWHYQDPLGNIQGPFCLFQLRKWNSNAYFPLDLRVWRMNDTQEESILLTDALSRQHSTDSQNHMCSQSKGEAKSDDGQLNSTEELSSNGGGAPWIGCNPNEVGGHSYSTDIVVASDNNEESTTTSDRSSQQLSDNPVGLGPPCVQNTIAQLVESLFSIEEPCSDTAATSSSPTMHMTPRTESSDPSSPVPKSDNLVLESGPPSSLNIGGPDSINSWGVTSSGTEAINLSSTVVKSEPSNIVDNNHPVVSNIVKGLSPNWETGSHGMEFTDFPNTTPKTGNTNMEDNYMGNKHDSGIKTNAPVEKQFSPHLQGQEPGRTSCGTFSNISGFSNAIENKHCNPSSVPEQNSETCWSTISAGGIVLADLPDSSSQKPDGALKPPLVDEHKHGVTSNIQGQDFGSTWRAIATGIEFSDLPATSLKLGHDVLRSLAVENKQDSATPNVGGQETCISWSTASSLVGEVHLHDIGGEWGAYSNVLTRPVQDLNSGLVGSSAKLANVPSDHTTRTSDGCQLTTNLDCDPLGLGWQPIELSTLGDESVSDLLSEVEAMESLRGMSSPTSRMNCGDDSMDRDDCFSPHKSFLLDINYPPQTSCALTNPSPEVEPEVKPLPPPMVYMPLHVPISETPPLILLPPPPPPPPLHNPISETPPPILLPPPPPPPLPPVPPPPSSPPPPPPPPPQKSPSPPGQPLPSTMSVDRHPSSPEEGEFHRAQVPVRHPEVVIPQNHQGRTSVKKSTADTSRRQGSETRATGFEPPKQENTKPTSTGSILGSPNMHFGNVNWNPLVGSQDTRTNQISPRYRHPAPKERSHHHQHQHHGVEVGFGKSSRQSSWNRQSSFGGGSSRPSHTHRGPRVCKFYESGYCKNGASCKYLHP